MTWSTKKPTRQSRRTAARKARQQAAWLWIVDWTRDRYVGIPYVLRPRRSEFSPLSQMTEVSKQRLVEAYVARDPRRFTMSPTWGT